MRPTQKESIPEINLFDLSTPLAHANLNYAMSTPQPLQDPCGYASSQSAHPSTPQCHRISIALSPTFRETNAQKQGVFPRSSQFVDPCVLLAKSHNITEFKNGMTVAGQSACQYVANKPSLKLNQSTSTPVKPVLAQPTSAKRRHATDGDVSFDTMRSVLKLVDEELLFTPEKVIVDTPKVVRAAPVPSPRNLGPTFAYESNGSEFDLNGGLPDVPLTPFGVLRI